MKDTTSVPLITDALEREEDPQVQINLASSLLLLHSPAAGTALLHICKSASSSEDLRLNAASRLVEAGDLRCLSSVLDILQTTTDSSVKASALLIMAHVKTILPSMLPTVHAALLASLRDPTAAVRQYASECIASLDDKAAIPYLQTAITNELDEATRERMQQSLETIERKP
jgi:HEAT repeat protein